MRVVNAGAPVYCQKCPTVVATVVDGKVVVRIGRQAFITSMPLSTTCPKCGFMNHMMLTDS